MPPRRSLAASVTRKRCLPAPRTLQAARKLVIRSLLGVTVSTRKFGMPRSRTWISCRQISGTRGASVGERSVSGSSGRPASCRGRPRGKRTRAASPARSRMLGSPGEAATGRTVSTAACSAPRPQAHLLPPSPRFADAPLSNRRLRRWREPRRWPPPPAAERPADQMLSPRPLDRRVRCSVPGDSRFRRFCSLRGRLSEKP